MVDKNETELIKTGPVRRKSVESLSDTKHIL